MDKLQRIVNLVKEREDIIESLDRLKKNVGMTPDHVSSTGKVLDPGAPKCKTIKFEVRFGAHLHSSYPDLNMLLVDTAISFLENELQAVNETLLKVEESVTWITD
jgi:hypothetical protein